MKSTIQRIARVGLVWMVLLGCAISREVRLADQFAGAGNWEGAIFLYQEAAQKDPKNLRLRQRLNEAKAQAAGEHYQKGRDLLKEKNLPQALEEFKRAMTLDPAKQEHQAALNEVLRLKEAASLYAAGLKLMRAERFSEALEQFEQALDLDPTLVAAQEMIRKLSEEQKAGLSGEVDLTLKSTQPITLKFQNAKLNEVFEFLSKATGINILFDKDVRPETLTVTIFVKNASFKEALNLIMATNNLFMKKISEGTILIIPKTKQKVDQYQDLMIRTFYLSSTKAEEMVNLLRTMLETRRVYVNKDLNALVLRDTPEKIKLAEKIIEANDRMVAEVMFEVEILEVERNKQLKYGISLSNNQIRADIGKSTGEKGEAFVSLDTLRSGGYTYFFTIPSVIVDFLKTEGEAKTLANPRIRVLDNKQAEVTIGEKFPIQLSTTTTTAATTTSAIAGQTTTQSTEFKDVAIKLGVKPRVLLNNDVTLELTLDITTLGSFVLTANQFRFGNRSVKTVLNVKNGETVVIGGLIRDEDRISYNKIPGLGDIPFLGKFFSSTDKNKVQSDVVMTITPHVIRGLEAPD
ncbi:MAG TPA: tetratricopeptide repeat protein, partial [Nitrospiria bacterium]|nr:tetratricopeptide repeat protein [Nitrospiria bacterium]